jgi:hypothetical protein
MREAGSVARNALPAAAGRGQKFFKIFFAGTLKFPKTRPITHPDDREWVEKLLQTTLKFAETHPITGL